MFDAKDIGLDEFRRDLQTLEKEFPKQARLMLQRVGNKGRQIVVRRAKSAVNKDDGDYYRSIKRGKVFKSDNGEWTVRVYPSAKIAWYARLIEDGWIHTGHEPDKEQHGFIPGKKVFEKSGADIEEVFDTILEEEFDRILRNL